MFESQPRSHQTSATKLSGLKTGHKKRDNRERYKQGEKEEKIGNKPQKEIEKKSPCASSFPLHRDLSTVKKKNNLQALPLFMCIL